MAIHIQVGKQKRVAVVFSCPGRYEESAGYPAAGATGKNLDALLKLLSIALNRSDLNRADITITNAWPQVEYRAKTGRSEATGKEVMAPENLVRLQGELAEISDLVIFCGKRAKAAAAQLQLKYLPKFVYIGHLGLRGLSTMNKDVKGEPIVAADIRAGDKASGQGVQRENTQKRLQVLVLSILSQLQTGK